MDIGEAVRAIKAGHRVARKGWNGTDMWVSWSAGNDALPAASFWSEANKAHAMRQGGGAKVNPSMTIKNPDNSISFWAPSMGDTLAEDWFVVE